MTRTKRTVMVGVAGALILAGGAAAAKEAQFRQVITVRGNSVAGGAGIHHLTFSGPIALPGVTLAPGSYTFRKMGPHVLQVASAREGTPYAMLLTRPDVRNGPLDQYEIVLGLPLTEGAPKRLEAWFVPGESYGQQLIYRNR